MLKFALSERDFESEGVAGSAVAGTLKGSEPKETQGSGFETLAASGEEAAGLAEAPRPIVARE